MRKRRTVQRRAGWQRPARGKYRFRDGSESGVQGESVRQILRSTGAQARLSVGTPNDAYEQEADRVADRVTAMPDAQVQRVAEKDEEEQIQAKPLADQITPLVQRKADAPEEEEPVQAKRIQRAAGEEEDEPVQAKLIQRQEEVSGKEEDEKVQAKSTPDGTGSVSVRTESNINSLRGGGEALDKDTRSYFEPRFGTDFSKVRVHSDARAANAATDIQARAFTLGNHVAFGAGEYAPATTSGRKLLAHELTHVVQQRGGAAGNRTVSREVLQRDPAEDQAKTDYAKFKADGPYKWPDYTIGSNGKFDIEYKPASNLMDVNMKVKFLFPMSWWASFSESGVSRFIRMQKEKTYRESYIRQVTQGWSRKFAFRNVRAPGTVWGQLNPTQVSVNVREVESGQHFIIKAQPDKQGGAQVSGGVTELYKGDDKPQENFNPGTGAGELTRVRRINPSPILFAKNSSVIPDDAKPKLSFLATYLKRVHNPRFTLSITGHSNTGGKVSHNQELSEQRAAAVEKKLKDDGMTNHDTQVAGVGETGATADAAWRKAVIREAISPGWKNKQDVTVHEFGHMVGLGDEYAGSTANATHYDLVKQAFGQDYADQVAKREGTDSASIMEGGDDVRIQHYVTFWKALGDTTRTKPSVPTPRFSLTDWKFKE